MRASGDSGGRERSLRCERHCYALPYRQDRHHAVSFADAADKNPALLKRDDIDPGAGGSACYVSIRTCERVFLALCPRN